jgi:hypothetical protein
MPQRKHQRITVTAQVERTFVVQGDEEQAKKRLHNFLKDPESIREGLVTEEPEDGTFKNTTSWRINGVGEVSGPQAVEDAGQKAS